jgi:hypothetical protein
MSKTLTHELLRRIFGNVGAVPGPNFGKVGLVTPECLYEKKIVVEFSDGTVSGYPVWIGQPGANGNLRVAVTNLGTVDSPEFMMAISLGLDKEEPRFGLHLDVEAGENSSWFLQWLDDKKLTLSTLHQLNITVAFELLTQEGVLWLPVVEGGDVLYECLVTLVEASDDGPAHWPDGDQEKRQPDPVDA